MPQTHFKGHRGDHRTGIAFHALSSYSTEVATPTTTFGYLAFDRTFTHQPCHQPYTMHELHGQFLTTHHRNNSMKNSFTIPLSKRTPSHRILTLQWNRIHHHHQSSTTQYCIWKDPLHYKYPCHSEIDSRPNSNRGDHDRTEWIEYEEHIMDTIYQERGMIKIEGSRVRMTWSLLV